MANIELKKLKKFFDKKTTEQGTLFNKRAVESETFFIGEGTLVFKNYFISLDAIAAVTLNQLQDISIKRYVIYLILCFLIFFVPFSVIKVMSVIGIIICGITIFLIWLKNKNKIYTLRIDLCNGSHYLYSHNNKEFICQVADLIRMCIDDRGGVFTIVSNENRIENYIDQSVTGDNNMYIGKARNIASGNSTVNDFGKKNKIRDNIILDNHEKTEVVLNENEWETLEQFLAERQMWMFGTDYENISREALNDVGKKDAKSLKDKLKKIGQKGISEIFFKGVRTATQVTIKAILQKILMLP